MCKFPIQTHSLSPPPLLPQPNLSGIPSNPSASPASFVAPSLSGVGSKVLLIGGSEGSRDSSLLLPFRKEFTIVRAAGAGYKLLCLCEDLAHAYLLTKPTTYRWDTCAPHAILKAKGGNVYNWQKLSDRCRQFAGGGSKELLRELVERGGNEYELKYHLEESGEVRVLWKRALLRLFRVCLSNCFTLCMRSFVSLCVCACLVCVCVCVCVCVYIYFSLSTALLLLHPISVALSDSRTAAVCWRFPVATD